MPTDRVMSKKLGFLDLALSTDIIVRKHKNIKESPPKYAWMCSFNFRKNLNWRSYDQNDHVVLQGRSVLPPVSLSKVDISNYRLFIPNFGTVLWEQFEQLDGIIPLIRCTTKSMAECADKKVGDPFRKECCKRNPKGECCRDGAT